MHCRARQVHRRARPALRCRPLQCDDQQENQIMISLVVDQVLTSGNRIAVARCHCRERRAR
jgi:hypothetical protein